jgi:nucleoside-diphosphate-sugar epimerase
MAKTILVAGATGDLGGKIVDELINKNTDVRALIRSASNPDKVEQLRKRGVDVYEADMMDKTEVAKACKGVHCVISALAGLREVIIDAQKVLLEAAVDVGVPRFIPSDFSLDFTQLVPGKNRNLDMRREFHTCLDKQPIAATSIFNAAFMELLTGEMPLILNKPKMILCWGSPDQVIDFTTTYNVAKFTAHTALDSETPRYLHIAGDRITCREIKKTVSELTGKKYRLLRAGPIGMLNLMIKATKTFSPGKDELYPPWQGMQYMRDMMEGLVKIEEYDNDRYSDIQWTSVREYLESEKIGEQG